MENRLRDSLPWLIDCFVRLFFAAEENAFSEAFVLLLCSYEVLISDKSDSNKSNVTTLRKQYSIGDFCKSIPFCIIATVTYAYV